MTNLRSILALGIMLVLSSSSAWAQDTGMQSPHGDWITDLVCADCHSQTAWSPLAESPNFDHAEDGGFELIAAHSQTNCASCHDQLHFSPPILEVRQCADCHTDVHAGKLIQSCDTCHNNSSFLEVDGYSIHQQTEFPLMGTHEVIACESCHTDHFGGAYFGEAATCITCHESDYSVSTVLPHAENGFSESCETCHTQFIWQDAIFPDHALVANGFELIGAHDFAGCESCHLQPSFELVYEAQGQNDCIACHESDYQKEHGGSGYPTQCLECHNQENWDGAGRFDHDGPFFPIYSGAHKGEWNGCVDCHQAAPIMTSFTCISCHEHNQPDMDGEHDDVDDYVYESLACLSCHPTGREEDND